jgi:hypothetical protein
MPRTADPSAEQPITRTVLLDARLSQVKDTGKVEIHEVRMLPGRGPGLHVHNVPWLAAFSRARRPTRSRTSQLRFCGPEMCFSSRKAHP